MNNMAIPALVGRLMSGELQAQGSAGLAQVTDALRGMGVDLNNLPPGALTGPAPVQPAQVAPRRDLRVFYHVVNLPGWQDITHEQMELMASSGLLDQAQLYINMNYSIQDYAGFRYYWNTSPWADRIHWTYAPGDRQEQETPTAILMQKTALATDQEFYALYLHQKGITHTEEPRRSYTRDWRHLMNWVCIERWQDCVAALESGYDAAGPNWHPKPYPHFSGNFHWAKASFLRRIRVLRMPRDVGYQHQVPHETPWTQGHRMDVEAWYGADGCKGYNIYDSQIDHYWTPYPRELYRRD